MYTTKLYIWYMKQLLTFLLLVISAIVFSQAPQSIPYQAVVRNTDGTAMANAAVTITFKIHDNSATGTVVYEETHTTTTNAHGLVSLNVGGGTAVTGTFVGIQWGAGNKFLHVLMNAGSGVVDLGTQQMMSVPYALYVEDVPVRVSVTGDSLFIGDQVSIVPGVSAANDNCQTNIILHTCGLGDVHNPSICYGLTFDLDGNQYKTIKVLNQTWLAENLKTQHYNNGDLIPQSTNSNMIWSDNVGSLFSDLSNCVYGNLYNWAAINDPRGVCPVGWRVPSLLDWKILLNYIDSSIIINEQIIFANQNLGEALRSTNNDFWYTSLNPSNSVGFSALSHPVITQNGIQSNLSFTWADYWTTNQLTNSQAMEIHLFEDGGNFLEAYPTDKSNFFNVRCVKD
jgi:uncharacterized protein (TIGR02145 family)